MRPTIQISTSLAVLAVLATGCGHERGVPPDEALARAKADYPDEDLRTPAGLRAAAERHYPPAALDYFEDMDAVAKGDAPGARKLELNPEQVIGRNAWVLWAGGNEAFWDWLARHSYGSTDLLKLIDSRDRGRRFARAGLITEPGMRPPTDVETREAHGVRYDRPVTDPVSGGPVHVEYRKDRGPGWEPARYDVYGYPTGVVGLRLFRNPEFTGQAAARWNANLYYEDSDAGRAYASRADTIRPFRVGMSCGFCHIAPHPLKPPADPEFPEWENLSNNIGNQYLRVRAVFGNTLTPDNFLYHVLDAQLPGTVDTSLIPSDNINNPNTINSFFGLPGRVERAGNNPREAIGPDTTAYMQTYVDKDFRSPRHVPRVLLDGSDSVGVHIALSRVYLNIGTHHQQWVRLHNPLLGFRPQEPFKLRDVAENSLYWHATLIRIDPMAAYFLKATDPMRLRDAPLTDAQRKEHMRGDGLPWHADYEAGRQAFAKGCIACHSSVQPGDVIDVEELVKPGKGAEMIPALGELPPNWRALGEAARREAVDKALAPRRGLRLRTEDLVRLARGDGTLPPAYAQWAQEAVRHREFWEHKDPVTGRTVHNFLSTDMRIPVTVTHTNSARAAATNALHGHIWEDFASQTYKELDAVGPIRYRDPFSKAEKSYETPAGGPGYYRVPTLISAWATAPFLHNNAIGEFNNDPSVQGRLDSFTDSIGKLLWPDRRRTPGRQVVWDVDRDPTTVYDGWYEGKRDQTTDDRLSAASARKAADQLDADGGWVWRTTEESWVKFEGHHVPHLVAGVTGLSPFWTAVGPWVPSVVLVILGVSLLLNGPLVAFRERLEARRPWLGWVLGPVRWALGVGGLVLAAAAAYFVWYEFWPVVVVLDVATQREIPLLRAQAILLPVVLLASVGFLFFLHRLPTGGARVRAAQAFGVVDLALAVVAALGLGAFLSGHGAGVRFGPIPEGVPVNIIASMDPDAPRTAGAAARKALVAFVLEAHDAAEDGRPAPGRVEFEERVAPALLRASKSPDFVTDRGHDFEFLRRLSDQEKQELIALLKTL